MASQPDIKSLTLPGGIHALCAGSTGVPVVLLAGWPETAEAYLPVLPELAATHRVYAIDLPGQGESATPPTGDYTTGAISRLLQEAVASVVDEPFHLVGHDVGAWVAYPWAAQFPEQVRSVALMDAAAPGLLPAMTFPLAGSVNAKLFQFSFNALPGLPEILTQGREREFFDWLFETKAVHAERISAQAREAYVKAYSRPGRMTAGFAYYRAMAESGEQNVQFATKALAMPVLALGGSTGVGSGMVMLAKKVASNVTGGVIEDCGHYLMEEQPGEVAKALLKHWGDAEAEAEA